MIRFLINARLPPALARWIESRGYVAEHIHDFASVDVSDRWIWQYAGSINAVIVSKPGWSNTQSGMRCPPGLRYHFIRAAR
ncbi:MAG: DUF5615 family PIN-like protein [Gammaproteobacteria bacterium]|nr:DUF5615 family PIN-like protein [Gammaproteobacteria bacterium]